jgi:hypothetical protein
MAKEVRTEGIPDPDEPNARAGLTLILVIGGIFLTMIVVMVAAFIYFNNSNGIPTGAILPLF